MSANKKNQKNILDKLGIEKLNAMQEEAHFAIHSQMEIVLLSPTGTGKTLAFLLPIVAELDPDCKGIQVLILVPSRELAIQIEQVAREMGTGYKTNAVYGGRAGSLDKIDLKHPPSILIGTPGRVADHLRRENFLPDDIQTLVLDEFDKSLEIGFEVEMKEIISLLPNVKKRILTSATQKVEIPEFVGLNTPSIIDFSDEGIPKLKIKKILSPVKDKLQILADSIRHLGNKRGIVFCNYKESIQRVSDFLTENNISHACFHGGMEQVDRERALIKFRNGTYQIIVATDLAARGIDVPEMEYIIHYHLPQKKHEFTHRNGRTARMHNDGTAYVLLWKEEPIPDFIQESNPELEEVQESNNPSLSEWETIYISGGRKDKISKGDIAGLFMKQGKLKKEQMGIIELKQNCAYVAVHSSKVNQLIQLVSNSKLKKKKVRVSII